MVAPGAAEQLILPAAVEKTIERAMSKKRKTALILKKKANDNCYSKESDHRVVQDLCGFAVQFNVSLKQQPLHKGCKKIANVLCILMSQDCMDIQTQRVDFKNIFLIYLLIQ